MDANELLLKEEVFQIVGAAMEVLNGLGHGLHEDRMRRRAERSRR